MARIKIIEISGLALVFLSLFLAFKSQNIYSFNFVSQNYSASGQQMTYNVYLIVVALITVLIGSYLIYRSITPSDVRTLDTFLVGFVFMVISVFSWAGTGSLSNAPGQRIYFSPITISIAVSFTLVGIWALLQHGQMKSKSQI